MTPERAAYWAVRLCRDPDRLSDAYLYFLCCDYPKNARCVKSVLAWRLRRELRDIDRRRRIRERRTVPFGDWHKPVRPTCPMIREEWIKSLHAPPAIMEIVRCGQHHANPVKVCGKHPSYLGSRMNNARRFNRIKAGEPPLV